MTNNDSIFQQYASSRSWRVPFAALGIYWKWLSIYRGTFQASAGIISYIPPPLKEAMWLSGLNGKEIDRFPMVVQKDRIIRMPV